MVASERFALSSETHSVTNQPPVLQDYNLYCRDRALAESIKREGAGWADENLQAFGQLIGREETIKLGYLANENTPILKTHDRFGHRIDEVEFHPAWHDLLSLSVENRLTNLPWAEPRAGAHVARAALMYLMVQIEAGHMCPVSMTFSCVPVLRKQPDVLAGFESTLMSNQYDRRFIPANQKRGMLVGMSMTEKQGGSDVRANTTQARPVQTGGPGQLYELTGHKWFCSHPMSDAFVMLAQAQGGLSCFLVPRFSVSGEPNQIRLQRLKSKLGNKSNASAEIELDGAHGWLINEEGRGVSTIIEMVSHTRLDCALSSAGLMRQAFTQALHHTQYRSAFKKRLIEHDLMRNVLCDLALESEAATVLTMRLARAYDAGASDKREDLFRRIATAVAKYWICKRAPGHVYECLETLGGNGYVEESMMPRLYREAPVNSVWEGSGNVICLDVLRALSNEPETATVLLDEIKQVKGQYRELDGLIAQTETILRRKSECEARQLVEQLAVLLQAKLLAESSPGFISDAFIDSRVKGGWGRTFGTLTSAFDADAILQRAF
ncbi:MAG: isovaleryl-CoA dehydrogenase [Candidatus Obscuribacterales bacterium]|nr:isovaleryl-CoA dehydrogenase [Candidatus Obscuribacterales bacterium]